MMKQSIYLTAFLSSSLILAENPARYLEGRMGSDNGRYKTFCEVLRLMTERKVKTIVETGTARCGDTNFDGDGGSTILFSHWAKDHNAHLFSVDISQKFIEIARKAVIPYRDYITLVVSDSVLYLKNFDRPIDFLYLDSWDSSETEPLPAQIHNLKEIQAAYDKLTPNSIIMIDDCNIPGGGKGKLTIQWLLERGWYLHVNKHHVIMLKK